MPMLPEALLDHLQLITTLEERAAADPGREEDHDHVTSEAYDAYSAAFRHLFGLLDQLPQPLTWIQLFEWTRHNNHYFGDAEMHGHLSPCTWIPQVRSVRTVLLRHMLRAAEENPEADMWANPQLQKMLADRGWQTQEWKEIAGVYYDEGSWNELRARIVLRLGRKFSLAIFGDDPVTELVLDLTDPTRLFSVIDLKLTSTWKSVILKLQFTFNAGSYPSFPLSDYRPLHKYELSLVDARSLLPIRRLAELVLYPKSGLKAYSNWRQMKVKLEANQVELVIPKELWVKEGIRTGTQLAVKVRIHNRGEFVPDKTVSAP